MENLEEKPKKKKEQVKLFNVDFAIKHFSLNKRMAFVAKKKYKDFSLSLLEWTAKFKADRII